MTLLVMKGDSDRLKALKERPRLLRPEEKSNFIYNSIRRIIDESFEGPEIPSDERLTTLFQGTDVFVKESWGHLVGFALVSSRPEGSQYLDVIAVDPTHRGIGLGSQLVRIAVCSAKAKNSTVLNLTCRLDNPAQKLYFDLGFRVVGVAKRFYSSTIDGLMMRHTLRRIDGETN